MPRFGRDYRMYDKILPSIDLDITDIVEGGMCLISLYLLALYSLYTTYVYYLAPVYNGCLPVTVSCLCS